jgi:hypothetical protein
MGSRFRFGGNAATQLRDRKRGFECRLVPRGDKAVVKDFFVVIKLAQWQ